jgi:tRNA dimethylallyltransferase
VKPILVVVGPTASGKTALGAAVCKLIDGEVVSADSMQVYRGMEIGTAAPTSEERKGVPHHFVSVLDPGEPYSAGRFADEALEVIRDIERRGKRAVVVGGSGLYVQALVDGLFNGPARDQSLRDRLHERAREEGAPVLYAELQRVDPDYAAAILPGDVRRIVRALEVRELTGEPLSRQHRRLQPVDRPLPAAWVAADYPREVLYERIDMRVDAMLDAGFVEEVRRLMERGQEEHLKQLRTVGYREFSAYLRGACSYEEARALMQRNSRRLAKRQLSWWRGDDRIHWFAAEASTPSTDFAEACVELLQQTEQKAMG